MRKALPPSVTLSMPAINTTRFQLRDSGSAWPLD